MARAWQRSGARRWATYLQELTDDDCVGVGMTPLAKEGEEPTNYWTKNRAAKFASRGKYGVLIGGPQALSEYMGNQTATPPSSPTSSGTPSGPKTSCQ
eukprot:COSAG01_NODE_23456_length_814_cov_2.927273_1_plen_97_part_01